MATKSLRHATWTVPTWLAAVLFLLSSAAFVTAQEPGYRLNPGHLGVGVTEITSDRASALKLGDPRGVEVRTVEPDSPADQAGIAPGDVLLSFNSEEILSAPQLGRLVNETPAGRKVKIQYWRQGRIKSIIATLTAVERDDAPGPPVNFSGLPMGSIPDIPRMLMLWENVALGIECEPLDSQLAQYFGVHGGVLIRRIEKGFAADRAGMRAGDVITEIDNKPLAAPRDLISYLRTEHQPGKALLLSVLRDHKPRSFSVNLNE